MQVAPTLTATAWHPRHDGISIDSKEIANASNRTRRSCKASIRKYAANIFCQVCTSDSRANDKLVSKFYKNIRRKYIGKRHGQKIRRVNNFPRIVYSFLYALCILNFNSYVISLSCVYVADALKFI